jgi:hypothetical protein
MLYKHLSLATKPSEKLVAHRRSKPPDLVSWSNTASWPHKKAGTLSARALSNCLSYRLEFSPKFQRIRTPKQNGNIRTSRCIRGTCAAIFRAYDPGHSRLTRKSSLENMKRARARIQHHTWALTCALAVPRNPHDRIRR